MRHAPASSLGWPARLLAVVTTAALGLGLGVVAAEQWPTTAEAEQVVTTEEPVADDDVDLTPLGSTAARLVGSLRADLPTPEPSPLEARAPTPEVRHGQLEIPAIGLSQPLFEGVTLTAIDQGPSHWPGTAMPGELGNVVVAGHRTTVTRPFFDLDLLQPGDELIFTMLDGERHVYALDRIEIVDESALHIVDQSYGYRATLFACHPKGSARQRIVGHFTLATDTTAAPA
ncbi:MAG: sortase [Acidimicrobiales bacterium]